MDSPESLHYRRKTAQKVDIRLHQINRTRCFIADYALELKSALRAGTRPRLLRCRAWFFGFQIISLIQALQAQIQVIENLGSAAIFRQIGFM
jgi:hypothetical protein